MRNSICAFRIHCDAKFILFQFCVNTCTTVFDGILIYVQAQGMLEERFNKLWCIIFLALLASVLISFHQYPRVNELVSNTRIHSRLPSSIACAYTALAPSLWSICTCVEIKLLTPNSTRNAVESDIRNPMILLKFRQNFACVSILTWKLVIGISLGNAKNYQ